MASRLDVASQLARLAGLGDEPRRALYRYVAGESRPVSRDEAASAVDISRPLAAYHLDRLADSGLLDVSFQRRSGRQGPGAGRPAKLYSRSAEPVELSVPARDYAFLAELLARSLESEAAPPRDALRDIARHAGAVSRSAQPATRSGRAAGSSLGELLAERGYEPYEDAEGTLRLRNCPFQDLARDHRELVCGANLAFVEGIVGAVSVPGVRSRLDPRPDECCVAIDQPGSSMAQDGPGVA